MPNELAKYYQGRGCKYALESTGWKYLLVIKQYSHYTGLRSPLTIKIGISRGLALSKMRVTLHLDSQTPKMINSKRRSMLAALAYIPWALSLCWCSPKHNMFLIP